MPTPVCTGGTARALYQLTLSNSANAGWGGRVLTVSQTDGGAYSVSGLTLNAGIPSKTFVLCLDTGCFDVSVSAASGSTAGTNSWALKETQDGANANELRGTPASSVPFCTEDGGFLNAPTNQPTYSPFPTRHPTPLPTAEPTPRPTAQPTPLPSALPTPVPTAGDTVSIAVTLSITAASADDVTADIVVPALSGKLGNAPTSAVKDYSASFTSRRLTSLAGDSEPGHRALGTAAVSFNVVGLLSELGYSTADDMEVHFLFSS